MELPNADAQIGFVELVRDIPAQWPELSSFLHQGMEKAQAKEKLFECMLLCEKISK